MAEDLLQEVFLKAYQALPRFRFESSFSTWIYRIALNEAKYQKRQRKNWLPLEEISKSLLERDASPDQLLVHILEERQAIVQHALQGLAAKLRTVLILKYVDDLSYEEIAEILQCSTGTVASRLSRALRKLERKLRPFEKIF